MPKANLTKSFVEKAKCIEGRAKIEFFDTMTTGFTLEVRSGGGKTFYVRFRDEQDKQRQIRVGTFPVVSTDQARKKAQEILNQIALGEDPLADKLARKNVPSLNQFIADRYLPFIKGYKRSWDTDESLLRNHILPVFGSHPMNKISRYDLTKFVHAKKEAGLAPGTANRLTIIMRYIFNLALQWDLPAITENPARGVRLFQLNNKTERYLTNEEVPKLLAAMRASPNKQLEPIVTMLLLTGARKREVLDARWKDITLNTRLWRVPTTKAGHARHVPLSEAAIELLDTLPSKDSSDYLFPNLKTGRPFVSIFHAWDTARRLAGMPEVRIHDLRHSFASFLINAGYSLYVVQKLLGHHSISVTERYSHLAPQTLLDAANGVAKSAFGSVQRETAASSTPPPGPPDRPIPGLLDPLEATTEHKMP